MIPVLAKDGQSLEGRKFRFIVRSAEEAVRVIREHLGSQAQVLSVNQVEGKGLAKFLSAPKLEVIAMVPPKPAPEPEEKTTTRSRIQHAPLSNAPDMPSTSEELFGYRPTDAYNAHSTGRSGLSNSTLSQFLKKSGFSELLIHHFELTDDWKRLEGMPMQYVLSELIQILTQEYKSLRKIPVTRRIAFLGAPGVGKTVALCKQLTRDVFVHQASASIFQLESDLPTFNEALKVFCETLGASWIRDAALAKNLDIKGNLYVDITSPSLKEASEWDSIRQQLDDLQIDTRIWVANAAYSEDALKMSFEIARKVGATHSVFSHVDEVGSMMRLWPYILMTGLCPLFLSHGQNITGDLTEDILGYAIQHTFPELVIRPHA